MSWRAVTQWAVLAVVAVVTAACAAGAASAPPRTTGVPAPTLSLATPSTSTSSTTTPTTSSTTSTTVAPQAVTIALGGDVYGQSPVRETLDRGGNPLAAIAPLLQAADLAVVNLETAVGTSGEPRDKRFVFQADAKLLVALRDGGVDAVSVANNHSFDHGLDGFLETLDNVKAAGLRPFGGGRDAAEAYGAAVFEAGGVKIALVGVAVIGPGEDDRAADTRPGTTNGRDRTATLNAIRAAKKITPIVIAVVHWGAELAPCPRDYEMDLAARMLDAGASAVIGAHPHVLQGITFSEGKLVAYSVGNFVFAGLDDATRRTGVITLTIAPDGAVMSYAWDPASIDDRGHPIPLTGTERTDAQRDLRELDPRGPACEE